MEKDAVEFPKWVVPHESHVVRKSSDGTLPHVSVPAFPEFHVNRVSGEVTVCVGDEEAEKLALSGPAEPDAEAPEYPRSGMREITDEVEKARALAAMQAAKSEQPSDESLGDHITDKLGETE